MADSYASGSPDSVPMTVYEVVEGLPFEGEIGRGLLFRTNRGDLKSILHQSTGSEQAVIFVCGARGGFCLLYTSPSPRDRG